MILEGAANTITTQGIFTVAGDVMNGVVTLAGNFFTSLWDNPMGQIVIGLSLAGAGVGLAYRLFLRKKSMR